MNVQQRPHLINEYIVYGFNFELYFEIEPFQWYKYNEIGKRMGPVHLGYRI